MERETEGQITEVAAVIISKPTVARKLLQVFEVDWADAKGAKAKKAA